MNENAMQMKDRKMAKYRRIADRFRKTLIIVLVTLLVLLLLPIGAFFGYIGYINIGKHEIYTCTAPDGHILTVIQNGRQERLLYNYCFTVKIDGESYLKFTMKSAPDDPSVYDGADISCASDSSGDIVLRMGKGTSPPEIHFSADLQKIVFLRCASYTLLKKDMEVAEYELIDRF